MIRKFILHDDVIVTAASGFTITQSEDDICLRLLNEIYSKQHKIIVSVSLKAKYKKGYRDLQKKKVPINPIVPHLLPEIFVSSDKVIVLRDSAYVNPDLDECDNKVVNLALDDLEGFLVTQNESLLDKIKSMNGTLPKILTPSKALELAISD